MSRTNKHTEGTVVTLIQTWIFFTPGLMVLCNILKFFVMVKGNIFFGLLNFVL